MNNVVLSAVANVHVRLVQAGLVPVDSGPVAPPGVESRSDTLLGWAKWVCFFLCSVGVIGVAISNRRGEIEDHAKGLAAILCAAILCGIAGSLIQALQ